MKGKVKDVALNLRKTTSPETSKKEKSPNSFAIQVESVDTVPNFQHQNTESPAQPLMIDFNVVNDS